MHTWTMILYNTSIISLIVILAYDTVKIVRCDSDCDSLNVFYNYSRFGEWIIFISLLLPQIVYMIVSIPIDWFGLYNKYPELM